MRAPEDVLAPPSDSDVERALELFAKAGGAAYGDRLVELHLLGSRARGDHEPSSDADVVLVLGDTRWRLWEEKMRLADMTYDILIEAGVDVQALPIGKDAWEEADLHGNPALVLAMRRDAKPLRLGG